jgi:uncharacterized membrane protein YhhN
MAGQQAFGCATRRIATNAASPVAAPHCRMHLHALPPPARILPLQWAMAVCGVAALLSSHFSLFSLYAILKPLTMALALVCVWQVADRHRHPVATWYLLAGLGLSLVGDVCLLVPDGFIPGLVAFLLAHVCYIRLFRRDAPWLAHRMAAVAVLSMGAAIYAYLWTQGLPGALRIPVGLYVLVIALMASQAIGRAAILHNPGACSVAWGAVSFMASDTILAIDKFVQPVPGVAFGVLGSYYVAQWLIVHGMLQVLRHQHQNKSY